MTAFDLLVASLNPPISTKLMSMVNDRADKSKCSISALVILQAKFKSFLSKVAYVHFQLSTSFTTSR